jgi:uncharacterized metal-binding protein YceD (DUF177 family)
MAKNPKEDAPVEIKDEYELALEADVEDESLLERPANTRAVQRSL